MSIIILLFNFWMTFFFSGNVFPTIGAVVTFISVVCSLCIPNSRVGKGINNVIIRSQIKSWNMSDILEYGIEEKVLKSISFLVLSMKVGVIITTIFEVSCSLFIFCAIVIGSGYIIEQKDSGMDLGTAFFISVILVKIYSLLSSLFDRFVELIVKMEFKVLEIETK